MTSEGEIVTAEATPAASYPQERFGDAPTSMRGRVSYSLLGARIDAVGMDELNAVIASSVRARQKRIIANYNLHGLRLFHGDARMREFYARANVIHIDGMSLIILGKLLGLPLRKEHRTAYIDWMPGIMARAAQEGWRVFYLGSRPGIADKGAAILREQWPGLTVATHHGFFDATLHSRDNDRVVELINGFSPNVLMVGMGQPRQEHWILENHERISANAILNAGACINFVAGALPTPPRWMGPVGMEWLFRLATEPRRLWHRYLVEPWVLMPLILRELVRSIPRRLRGHEPFSSAKSVGELDYLR